MRPLLTLSETLELIQQFPGALQGMLKDRAGGNDEVELGAFVQDVAENSFWIDDDGKLKMSDGESYTGTWDGKSWNYDS